MMLSPLLQVAFVLLICRGLWTILRRFLAKSDLDNLPGPPAKSFIEGNLRQFHDADSWPFHKNVLEKYGKAVKLHGVFSRNMLYIYDPLAVHHIVVKDIDMFEMPPFEIEINKISFGLGLSNCLGETHKRQRKMLSPAFNVGHLRHMLPIFDDICNQLRDAMHSKLAQGTSEMDMDLLFACTALELIGQAGLGYSFDSFDENVPNAYAEAVKAFFPKLVSLIVPLQLLPFIVKIPMPKRVQRCIVDALSFIWKRLRDLRDTIDIMDSTSVEIFRAKKQALEQGGESMLAQVGRGKDIMSILLRANMNASLDDRLSEEELIGQITNMTFAAFETTSGGLSRIVDVLAHHPEAQQKLRDEIIEAKRGKESLDYDELVSLPYLEAVCRETLRLHAPAYSIYRIAKKDSVLPLSEPIKGVDGQDIQSITVPAGTNIIVGLVPMNCDPTIWGEDALEWRPERWLEPLPDSIVDARIPGVYANTMTFSGGLRACIGFKFAQLEMKTVLCTLLSSFTFAPAEDITWNFGFIQWPSVKGSSKPQLPLKVSAIERAQPHF